MSDDNAISRSTVYDYLHEGITALAQRAPSLESALLAAKMAGYAQVNIDGTIIETDRCRTPRPTLGWICGGRPNAATSRSSLPRTGGHCGPRRCVPAVNNGTTALREHTEILPLLDTWTADDLRVLGDAQRQPLPLEHRQDRRGRSGASPHRTRPHHLITRRVTNR